jgi:hypothetical protein
MAASTLLRRTNRVIPLHLLPVWLVALAAACSTWYRAQQ